MTRINCVPPHELTDAHLGAEYRELPRVFALAFAAWQRGDDPRTYPQEYTLGKGHVKFFYTRLGYLRLRFYDIVAECQHRGRRATYSDIPNLGRMPTSWWRDWEPTPEAVAINRARIHYRLTNPKKGQP